VGQGTSGGSTDNHGSGAAGQDKGAGRTSGNALTAGIGGATGNNLSIGIPSGPALTGGTLPGTTELTFPKDGKFSVVLSSSTAAAPYPESVAALKGKGVYTVYLRVGQRKNWILQYCLPLSAMPATSRPGAVTPLEAPFPYYVVRPDQAGQSDYALVHGMITIEGRFDQLNVLYPAAPDGKTLLLQALNKWTFRPAKRDGEPEAVEVLLIIPRQN
jgi:hypothetical protein